MKQLPEALAPIQGAPFPFARVGSRRAPDLPPDPGRALRAQQRGCPRRGGTGANATAPSNQARRFGPKATTRDHACLVVKGAIACTSSRDDGSVCFRAVPGVAIGALESVAGQPRWHDAVAEAHARGARIRRQRARRRLRGQRRDGDGLSGLGLEQCAQPDRGHRRTRSTELLAFFTGTSG